MRLYAARVWLNTYVNRTPAAVIPASKYPMIHNAVLDQCDALDGVKDGVIEDPAKCSFDFATLTCSGEDRADCLTKDQVETANAMTRPIRDPKSGAVLHPGRYYPGSELGWGGVAGPSPSGESHEGMRKIVFTPDWDYHTINVPDDVERAVKADKGLLYGGDPDLSRFFKRGGKLLMYHGWADPLVSPDTSLIMFKRIRRPVGRSGCEFGRAVHGAGHGALPGRSRHRRLRQSRRARSLGRNRNEAAVDRSRAHDRRRRRSHASAVRVSGDGALHRQRQHR